MQKPWQCWLIVLLVISMPAIPGWAAAAEEYAWVHTETVYRWGGDDWQTLPQDMFDRRQWSNGADVVGVFDDHTIEIRVTSSGRTPDSPNRNMHVIYTYAPPPNVIYPEELIEIPMHQQLISNVTGDLFTTISASGNIASGWDLTVAEPHPLAGERSVAFGQSTRDIPGLLDSSDDFVMARQSWRAGRPGGEQRIQLAFGTHSTMGGTIQLQYWYQWKPVPEETRSYTAWQPEPDPAAEQHCAELEERYYALLEELEIIVTAGDEQRAASPDFLEDLWDLIERHR